MFYVSVVGNAIRGEEQQRKSPLEPTTVSGFAFNAYKSVCGNGNAMGDGVVPVDSAHLDDATQITLDGVLHSINALDRWYGAIDVIDSWHKTMLEENQKAQRTGWAKDLPFFANLVN